MSKRLVLLLWFAASLAYGQAWSAFLDSSRAVDWTSAGFSIPAYSVNCATQPSLLTGSANAAANTTSIQNALASCDATHNVVNIPSGTYYIAGITFGTQGKQVLRGAGANSTILIFTADTSCGGFHGGVCLIDSVHSFNSDGPVLPPSGTRQCLWTGGLTQGSTSLTLSSCGGAPPLNATIILDQANDTADTSGIYICDINISNCGYEGNTGGNNVGRFISGVTHAQQQVTYTTGVTSLGGGSYTVTVSPGVYFSNVRSGQSPGAWWPGTVQNDGIENLSIDGTSLGTSNITLYDCYQCWVTGVRSENAARAHVILYQSANDVVKNNYFYQSQSHATQSYVVETDESSAFLVENNIFQQVTNALMFNQGSGAVIDYNFGIDNIESDPTFAAAPDASHNAGNEMNLWEGNDFLGIWADDAWGSSDQITLFRNMLQGWQRGATQVTNPIRHESFVRSTNAVGNILGEPGYHTLYQTYATSTTTISGGADDNTSIFNIGLAGQDTCSDGFVTTCDPLAFTTLMRWGNWDTVNGAPQWNATEASPAAVPYLNANFTSTYFGSLAHTLPNSLYYSSKPSWWGSEAWPPIGPDVGSGNIGECSGGTYAGYQATAGGQCTGGSLVTAWASHVNANPAMNCYLNVMGGPPDGTGSVLSFNPATCYAAVTSSTPAPPTMLMGMVK